MADHRSAWRLRRSPRFLPLSGSTAIGRCSLRSDYAAMTFIPVVAALRDGDNQDMWTHLLDWCLESAEGKLTIVQIFRLRSVSKHTLKWAQLKLSAIDRPHVFGGDDSSRRPNENACTNQIERLNWSNLAWEPVGHLSYLGGTRYGERRQSHFTATAIAGGVMVVGGVSEGGHPPGFDDGEDIGDGVGLDDVHETSITAGPLARKARWFNRRDKRSCSFEILEYSKEGESTVLKHDGASDYSLEPCSGEVCKLCSQPMKEPASSRRKSKTNGSGGGGGGDSGSSSEKCTADKPAWLSPTLRTLEPCGHVVHASCLAATGAEGIDEARRCPTCDATLRPSCQPLLERRTLRSEISTAALLQGRTSYDGSRKGHCACSLSDGRVLVVGGSGLLANLQENSEIDTFSTALKGGFMCSFTDETGEKNDTSLSKVYRGRECEWRGPIEPMSDARELFAMGLLRDGPQDVVLVCGGYKHVSNRDDGGYGCVSAEQSTVATCELYYVSADAANGVWDWAVPPMPQPRDNHAGVTLADGRFIVIGGRVAARAGQMGGYSNSCLAFTLTDHGMLPDDPTKAAKIKEIWRGRSVDVMSPSSLPAEDFRTLSSSLTHEELQKFVTRGRWEDFPSLKEKRSNLAACLVQSGKRDQECIVVTGGWGHEHTTEIYDTQLERWFTLPCRTSHPRKFHAMASIGM